MREVKTLLTRNILLTMKRILLLLGILFMLTDCKKDESPASALEPVLGKWYLVEYQTYVNEELTWVPSKDQYDITILPRGVILDQSGYIQCCAPEKLTVNGTSFKITKSTDPKQYNPMCMSVNCMVCPIDIEQSGNEMTITLCKTQQKYVRK